jgi:hypothetical protein
VPPLKPTSQKRDMGHPKGQRRRFWLRQNDERTVTHPCAIRLRMNGAPKYIPCLRVETWGTQLRGSFQIYATCDRLYCAKADSAVVCSEPMGQAFGPRQRTL